MEQTSSVWNGSNNLQDFLLDTIKTKYLRELIYYFLALRIIIIEILKFTDLILYPSTVKRIYQVTNHVILWNNSLVFQKIYYKAIIPKLVEYWKIRPCQIRFHNFKVVHHRLDPKPWIWWANNMNWLYGGHKPPYFGHRDLSQW